MGEAGALHLGRLGHRPVARRGGREGVLVHKPATPHGRGHPTARHHCSHLGRVGHPSSVRDPEGGRGGRFCHSLNQRVGQRLLTAYAARAAAPAAASAASATKAPTTPPAAASTAARRRKYRGRPRAGWGKEAHIVDGKHFQERQLRTARVLTFGS